MPRIEHNKLVRDAIPEIISANSETAQIRTIAGEEYKKALLAKLVEEAEELLESNGSLEERADVEEVLRALDAALGLDEAVIEQARKDKATKRGGFTLGVFLESTMTND